jgi:hypothetical protein
MYQFNPQHTGIFVDPSTIPVELESFTASVNSNFVTLNWVTATELNNTGFDIEQSIDNSSWNKIGFVNGNGTTTEKSFYTFTVKNPFEGNSYYRLKQIDYDGTFTYSNVVSVSVGLLNDFSLEQNYPNPFNPATIIKYNIPEESTVQIKIFNVVGEVVTELINEVESSGSHQKIFNASNLTSGIYFVKMNATTLNSGKAYSSMIKMIYMK